MEFIFKVAAQNWGWKQIYVIYVIVEIYVIVVGLVVCSVVVILCVLLYQSVFLGT